MRKDLDPSISAALRDALVTMHNNPAGRLALKEFGARRFIFASQKDYEPVIEYARKAGIDVKHFTKTNGR
jgi:ABC-type phosphate/phosphonate transport system substrate-binding protein